MLRECTEPIVNLWGAPLLAIKILLRSLNWGIYTSIGCLGSIIWPRTTWGTTNTTKNISTRISKNLYELIETMSKYTPRLVQLLEGSDDFSLLNNLQGKYQTYYKYDLYGAWLSFLLVFDDGTDFSFCCQNGMVAHTSKHSFRKS